MNLNKNISIDILKKKYVNENYLSWLNDSNNQKNIELSKKLSLKDLKKFYETSKKSKNILYGIFYLNVKKKTHIGNIHIVYINRNDCYIGYLLGNKKFRNKGISTYAVKLAIKECFEYYKFKNIYSNSLDLNYASLNLLKKNNFSILSRKPKVLNLKSSNKRKLLYFKLTKKSYMKFERLVN